MSDGRRPKRVAEDIRVNLGSALQREIADPAVSSVVITRVEVTPDLGLASVYVRLLVDPNERSQRAALRALQRAAGRLRRGLGAALRLKRVPELRFHYDEAPDARARVDELLDEIRREREE